MKATGIVRRIDDLGRVVRDKCAHFNYTAHIPTKEYRYCSTGTC